MHKIALSPLLAAFLLAAPGLSGAYTPLEPNDGQSKIDRKVVQQLQRHHYSRVELDDAFSEKLLNAYLDGLDGTHSIFLASDIERFRSQYRHALDEQLESGKLVADFDIYNTYLKRRIEIDEWLLAKIDDGIDKLDLSDKESFATDRSEAPWPADAAAQRALWTQQLENQVIDMRLNDLDTEEIEKRLKQRYENELQWLRQTASMDAFSAYMSAYAGNYDPHTDYLSPRDSEEFDISMNLELSGIGAELRSENGYAEVVRLIPGGPAAKNGRIQPTDQIVAVGQGKKGDFTDVIGMRLQDTVRLIRGKVGTTVRLQIQPGDGGDIETVKLVRDKIELKEQAASKKIIEIERDGGTARLGLIRLPAFYNGTADDVKTLLEKLKQEDVAGVILDLRNNGGGALDEVIELAGLFMGAVPAVQIRDANGDVQVTGDPTAEAAYAGPLAVMVNRLSASASEIFAGAVQDYGRGIILGSRTFGKGTVQGVMPLSRNSRQGRVTLTRAKFYRVSGDSTQRRGVSPDISFPSFVDPDQIGEETLPNALPWDQIDAIDYPQSNFVQNVLPRLQAKHNARVRHGPDFRYLVERIKLVRQNNQRERVSLVLEERRNRRNQLQHKRLALVNEFRNATGKEPFDSFAAFQESEEESTPADDLASRTSTDADETDAYQEEAAHILMDMTDMADESLTHQARGTNP